MHTHRLLLELSAHPAHPPAAIRSVEARIGLAPHGWMAVRWRVEGTAQLVVPPLARRGRTNGLWRTTCFELFCRRPGSAAYVELNLSPSERWAAYDFTSCREGMAARAISRAPVITPRFGRDTLIFDAAFRLDDMPPLTWQFGLCAVLEEAGGRMSYWALAHPRDRPDFHDPACFAARLEPPAWS